VLKAHALLPRSEYDRTISIRCACAY
jgi:hypothetical protein